ncbi:MAG: rhodanese-like domain-containing protein [Alphaproteobacteria bacterium]|nr:rhodanese-like domain-containing protein [Alphaproteobacteria bacterium]
MAELIDLKPLEVRDLIERENVLLVDVREFSEYSARHIKGSLLLPMSVFDPDDFPGLKGAKVVLICALGRRSVAAGKQLLEVGVQLPLFNLEGGIKAWAEEGLPLVLAPEDYSI